MTAELRRDHVGGVQASAEADLQHHHVHALFGENQQCHGGDGFEIGGVIIEGVGGVDPVESFGESIGGDGAAIDADALGGFGQVRGGEQAGA